MNKQEFLRQLYQAREELVRADNMAREEDDNQARSNNRSRHIHNALESLDALIHIEEITKAEQ